MEYRLGGGGWGSCCVLEDCGGKRLCPRGFSIPEGCGGRDLQG
ncbi:MAG: hypothetical protein ACPLZF_03290 [Nitrososphaeria archaeon]